MSDATRTVRKRGYSLIIGSIEEGSEDDERTYLRLMLERRVEGLIVAVPRLRIAVGAMLAAAVARTPTVAGADHVDIDNRRGGHEATGYLVAQRHRVIATITGPLDWPSARARLDGYRDALREAGISADRALVEPCVDWGLESGRRAAERLLSSAPTLTAIFAQSDLF